ncbi:hypothetical protein SAMN05421770_104336 [Granulicella rosea]|uniref:MerR HTH family regulatory protein n=1 Tax=Granulicella rosea TaxID=474952 RepID=A0A239K7M5_9BACT|nr:hypothetical protein [Granulicella rosea]SNT13758.1 hypothetical protein SAMN05421770_104336 [Granulicella rosea]
MDVQFRYTQEQARSVTGIGQEAIRHWRKYVPYLATKSGKAARFSFGDLVGLAVTRELTDGLGISISQVHVGVESLFHTLAAQTVIRPGSIALLQNKSSLLIGAENQLGMLTQTPAALVPIDPIIENLRTKFLNGLRLPPQSVLPFFAEAVSQ